ncbi:fibronectin type III domain-containing protein, partial [Flavobacterium sp. RHBU_24]|uniref:fibronectin type III domain-containing protein n=1 Tax=Flavobacterium sp. RHBU_24 TaxID=3391185 RepID=UPI003984AC05
MKNFTFVSFLLLAFTASLKAQDCDPEALPYVLDFELAIPPSLPECTSGTSGWQTSVGPGYGFDSNTLHYSGNSTPADDWFYTRGIQLTQGQVYKISFRYGNNDENTTGQLAVAFGLEATVAAMTNSVTTLNNITGAVASTASIGPLFIGETGVYYFGFHATSEAGQGDLFVDDILIEEWTCDTTANVTISDITDTGASLSWDAVTTGNTVQFYQYCIVAGTGEATPGPTTGTTSGASYFPLTPGSQYTAYVRTFCSGAWGDWVGTTFITTGCAPVTNLQISFIDNTSASISWDAVTGGNEVQFYQYTFIEGTGEATPGPITTGTTANSNEFFPLLPGTTYTAYVRTFCSGVWGDWVGATFTTTGCAPVTNLQVSDIGDTSASISWDAVTGGNEVQFYQYTFIEGTGEATPGPTTADTTANSNDFTLLPGTTYTAYVRTFCSGVWGEWIGATFTTTGCAFASLPYVVDFESVIPSSLPDCTSATGGWETTSNPGFGFDNNTLQYTGTPEPADDWFYTQGVYLIQGQVYQASFKYGNNDENTIGQLTVAYGTETNATAMTNSVTTLNNITGATADSAFAGPLFVGETGVYYFGFHATSDAGQGNLFVDDILIEEWTCDTTANITTTDITDTSASLSWDAVTTGHTVQFYQYSIVAGTGEATPGPTTGTTNGTSYFPLTPGSLYTAYVRTFCSGAWGDWVGTTFITTGCAPVTNLQVYDITNAAASISWDAVSGGNEVQFYQYTFIEGTGEATPGPTTTGTAAASDEFFPLLPNTTYTAYVRTFCSGIWGEWVGVTFNTLPYCIPEPFSQDNDGIVNFVLGTINNPTGSETGFYGDYTALSADVGQGTTNGFTITYATGFTYGTKIWVDWNNDYNFNNDDELVYTGLSSAANPANLTGTFTVPADAALGTHRLRIGGTDNNAGPDTACYNSSWGSFEDYTLNVTPPPACFTPVNITGTPNMDGTVNLNWTAPTLGEEPLGYEYVVSTSTVPPTESGTFITDTFIMGYSDIIPGTSYYLFVRTDCGTSTYSDWAMSAEFAYLPGDTCGTAINLASLTSPYTSTTSGAYDNYTPACAFNSTAADLFYSIDVPNGYTLTISQSNSFDSMVAVFYGSCDSATAIACFDDPDETQVTWTNSTGTQQTVYWVEDGYFSGSGAFTLTWNLVAPPCFDWTGAADTSWTNTANWCNGILPTAADDVTISASSHNPVISSGVAYANNLTVNEGAILTVNSGATLRVENTITS